ncbi:hypothetical protein MVEN_02544700 [Mycena venus]|uniref:Uncharacterized protein n=1 Tax=Mycena venus TaxID=2733690 RepID=A0A8H6U476_9AGAR|nr:hypothetical protein MVEN_02544700 [Mycena venus]
MTCVLPDHTQTSDPDNLHSRPRARPSKAKPESKALFDGVELIKRPHSYVGKGKGKERATTDFGVDDADLGSDVDADGEEVEVDGTMEPDVASGLQNSNQENEVTLTEIANADTDVDAEGEDIALPDLEVSLPESGSPAPGEDNPLPDLEVSLPEIGSPAPQITLDRPDRQDVFLPGVPRIGSPALQITVDHVEAARPKGEDALLPDEIGSPAPQIAIEMTDDQVEEARLNHHDVMSPEIGSPAPEITIEPMAEDEEDDIQFEPADADTVPFEGNGYSEENGLFRARPRLDIPRAGTPLNPEYSIEVYSPGSVQHDSDDEIIATSIHYVPDVNNPDNPTPSKNRQCPGETEG